ncbi:MAG TPA: J domain-containing protein [Thermoanaerobaculia bacterium]
MDLVAILFMLIGGVAIAAFVLVATAMASRSDDSADPLPLRRDSIAGSLLVHVVSAGGISHEEALRRVRRASGLATPVTRGIDVTNWAESYAAVATPEQRRWLLETAVQLVAAEHKPVPLRQYAALLDLSFGLGFQTDALAKLRQVYGFEYIDHASSRRERPIAAVSQSESGPVRQTALLRVLGISRNPTRQELTAAYRKLVLLHHPDRFHAAPEAARSEAAGRFMEITRAYEELLLTIRD